MAVVSERRNEMEIVANKFTDVFANGTYRVVRV